MCALIATVALCFTDTGAAQTGIAHTDSREAFASASRGLSTISFDAASPPRGFARFPAEEGLTLGGATFRARGGARFGAGQIYVVSADYGGANPLYNTGTLPLLSWAAPNRPGNASLDVTLPAGTTAVGCDLWTQQPYAGTVEVTATTADGRTRAVGVGTRVRPSAAFVGFISDAAIVSVSFRPPQGQTGLLLDNFTYGRRAEGRSLPPGGTAASQSGADMPAAPARPVTAAVVQPPPSQTKRPGARPMDKAPSAEGAGGAGANPPGGGGVYGGRAPRPEGCARGG
jgi:hypothetical protein